MSYDLFMKPRAGAVEREQFLQYFKGRPHYKAEGEQAWYQNEDTGTYFCFEYADRATSDPPDEGESGYPLSFNINFFRPTHFAKEAEPEVTAFVRHFDLLVDDPQVDGMGNGPYDPAKFLTGWARGNKCGAQAIQQHERSQTIFTVPSAELERIWRWNLERDRRQAATGEARFVPRICFLDVDGAARSAVVWPDAIPSLIPRVDYLMVHRDQLAPRRLLWRKPDTILVRWADAEPIIRKHATAADGPAFLLDYDAAPPALVEFVGKLPSGPAELKGITADKVLDAELVAKHAD